jgi:hypothetical protein
VHHGRSGGAFASKEESMFKKIFELVTLKWLWDRRRTRR